MKKIYVLAIFLFISTFSVVNAQDVNPDAEKLYKAAIDTMKAKNYDAAITLFDQALNIKKDYRYYYSKGVALKNTDKIDQAIAAFDSSIKVKDDFEGSYSALSGIYFGKKQYKEAITNYEKVLSLSQDEKTQATVKKNLAISYTMLGNTELSDGDVDSSIAIYNKALSYNPYDVAYLSLAKAYTKKKDYDNALVAADSAMANRTVISEGGPYFYMGLAYKNKGDKDKAKEMFTKAKSDETYKKQVEKELAALK